LKERLDIRAYNRAAWDREVERKNEWTVPVDRDTIEAARQGSWQIVLTPSKPVPEHWFPAIPGLDVLCLASGGGQQAPILAAVGANVTILDNSPKQLAQDRFVAERDHLDIKTIEGDMADLHMFSSGSFDLIFHPVSNCFVPDVQPVWRESFRVLRRGGLLLAGFVNPIMYLFDLDAAYRTGVLKIKYSLPYSDIDSLVENELESYLSKGSALEYSHSLEDQIGGQVDAGFSITGLYEDSYDGETKDMLDMYTPTFIATRALKP